MDHSTFTEDGMRGTNVLHVYMALFLVPLMSDFAMATPTDECRTLAKRFNERPDLLSQSELARLRKCVTDELSTKLEVPKKPVPGVTGPDAKPAAALK
jgi:hypothetical protein